MPRLSKLSRSKAIQDASITSLSLLDILAPALFETTPRARRRIHGQSNERRCLSICANTGYESSFFGALVEASLCNQHKTSSSARHRFSVSCDERTVHRITERRKANEHGRQKATATDGLGRSAGYRTHEKHEVHYSEDSFKIEKILFDTYQHRKTNTGVGHSNARTGLDAMVEDDKVANVPRQGACLQRYGTQLENYTRESQDSTFCIEEARATNIPASRSFTDLKRGRNALSLDFQGSVALDYSNILRRTSRTKTIFLPSPTFAQNYHTQTTKPKSRQRRFAEGSNLPSDFFDDVSSIKNLFPIREARTRKTPHHSAPIRQTPIRSEDAQSHFKPFSDVDSGQDPSIDKQMKLMQSVRELEEKLESARRDLAKSMVLKKEKLDTTVTAGAEHARVPVTLTKEDYKNLVDLYYYSHNSRFSPESTDGSPTPIVLNDYSFTLSSDFSLGSNTTENVNEEETYQSPLEKIGEMLKQRQLREIAVMQVFVDLLLDDQSSNRALYEAYKQLPEPGVAYLPKGTLRLFLQRMSVPWTLSEKSMLRYLSLIDDMQTAKLPITTAEWSSAVYLAGRAFSRVTDQEVKNSFNIWQTMEHDAGVQASNVTFNILFDIAVRSGRFALGETVLKEMHSRNLRLNRLGRVSLMYYHGLRKDGDGVRKSYRDFVEAGEIVDTLVMNCVIASLLNAQEPQAAEQTYARMKHMQSRIRSGFEREGDETLYKRYPDPGLNTIDEEMASNHLGRVLLKAPHLQQILPEHHKQLQASMPLIPDHTTFRCMVAYHATTSGDLDRITVLLQDMTDFFHLPLQTIFFQLLFKGFAFHGPVGGPQSTWSPKRLDLCWNACREAIKESNSQISSSSVLKDPANGESKPEVDRAAFNPTLPSISQVNAIPQHLRIPDLNLPLSRPPPPRLSGWAEFVLDLAAFPRERLKRLERFHATMFDAEDMNKPHEKSGVHTYSDPFFQSVAYTAPEPHLDTEEGEYELPNPSGSGLLYKTEAEDDAPSHRSTPDHSTETLHQVAATKSLVCWLIRAYARNTKSRAKVEEIWGQVRKIYKPRDAVERESVVRVLRRCLRDCDQEGSG